MFSNHSSFMRIEAWDELRGRRLSKAFYAEVRLTERYGGMREQYGDDAMRFYDVTFSLIDPSCWNPFELSRALNPAYWKEARFELIGNIEKFALFEGPPKNTPPLTDVPVTLEGLIGQLPHFPVPKTDAPAYLNIAVIDQLKKIAKVTGRYPTKLIKREKQLGKPESIQIVYEGNRGLQFCEEIIRALRVKQVYKKISKTKPFYPT